MDQRRVLVTGSSRGIGKAIAARLAKDGWSVALHASVPSEDMEEARTQIGKAVKGIYYADFSNPDRAGELFSRALNDGPVHALVNNAGVYLPVDFVASGEASFKANWHRTFAVNFESPVNLIRTASKSFAKQGGGKVVNVASRVGFRGEAGAAMYAASKAALINLTRSLAVELARKNIHVFGIAPGWTETAMARSGMEERLGEILATIPLGRMATPDDCAAVTAFLLSDAASYLSGIVIDVNGASYFH